MEPIDGREWRARRRSRRKHDLWLAVLPAVTVFKALAVVTEAAIALLLIGGLNRAADASAGR